MTASTPPLDFDHKLGDEIPTKHKEAIRQLYWVGKILIGKLESRYQLGKSTIRRILGNDALEHAWPKRTGRPQKLTDIQVNEIIEYCSKN
jgi:transposase